MLELPRQSELCHGRRGDLLKKSLLELRRASGSSCDVFDVETDARIGFGSSVPVRLVRNW